MPPFPALAALLALLSTAALAQGGPAPLPSLATLAQQAAKRFPQPVRTADLVGRDLLGPDESQPVLGHVAAVTRRADGGWDAIIRTGGLLGLGSRPVAVPIEAVALLGEHLALLGYTAAQLRTLPTAAAPQPIPDGAERIPVALVRPFH